MFNLAGNGGLWHYAHQAAPGSPIRDNASCQRRGDTSLQQCYNGYGYAMVTVTRHVLTIEFYAVHPRPSDSPLDNVTVNLQTHRITNQTGPLQHPLPGEGRGHLSEQMLFGT
jgi:hypothetical protein